MPAKTGASHAVASFTTIVLGALISNYLSTHSELIHGTTVRVGETLVSLAGLSLPETVTGFLLISTLLSFVWGVAYHVSRHGTDDGTRRATRPGHDR